MQVDLCTCECPGLWNLDEGIAFFWSMSYITGSCKLLDMDAGN